MAATFPPNIAPAVIPIRIGPEWVLAFIPSTGELRVFADGEPVSAQGGQVLLPDNPSAAAYGVDPELLQQFLDSNG